MTPDMYTSIRVPKKMLARLNGYVHRLTKARDRNPAAYPEFIRRGYISLPDALLFLLMQQSRHSARSGAAKLAKAARTR